MTWHNLPPFLLYPALLPHVIGLCFKHHASISIITKSNPAFPYGGLPFASKKQMFDLFASKKEFLPYILIKTNQDYQIKLKEAKEFIHKINYPVIAKPDTSHRGIDVNLIHNDDELDKLFNKQKWDYILQQYCDYDYEFGIFYCRLPNEPKGKIISLSSKTIPVITGNGKDNLKSLILNSDIDNKNPLLKRFSDKLEIVLKDNERFKTLVCASHAQGAIFRDAKEYLTEELINKTDEICNINGFYFGRLDVRAENIIELQKGNYKIIEVNGATSEFIHIYDQKYSLKDGIADLKTQWNILFEVSVQNRKTKANEMTIYQFFKEYVNFFLLTKKVTGKLW